jgi:hypothetical protein
MIRVEVQKKLKMTAHRIKLFLLIFLLRLDFHHIFHWEVTDEHENSGKKTSIRSFSSGYHPTSDNSFNTTTGFHDILSYNNSKIWLYDESHKVCFGWYGFHECGDVNLWILKFTEDGIQLQSVFDQSMCLGRSRLGGIKLRKCNEIEYFGKTIYWAYSIETGAFYSRSKMSQMLGSVCIVNGNSFATNDAIKLEKCKKGFTPLTIIPLEDFVQHNLSPFVDERADNVSYLSHSVHFETNFDPFKLQDQGIWKCPVLKRNLPRNLDKHLQSSNRHGRQVLMGAGVFSKVTIEYFRIQV